MSEPFVAGRLTWIRPAFPRWLWSGGSLIYDTALGSGEVMARLSQAIDPTGLASLLSPGQLRGWVRGRTFHATTNVLLIHNSFNSVLDGEVDDAFSGSRLKGTFRMQTGVIGFLIFWLGITSLFGVFLILTVLIDPQD